MKRRASKLNVAGPRKRPKPIFEDTEKKSFLDRLTAQLTAKFTTPAPEKRSVWVGHLPPLRRPSAIDVLKPQKYPSNQIKTSKYTLWNFIPKNLFEQFRRLANFYFLIIAIIQMSLPLSPVSPLTSVLPLIFVVVVTAVKQAYEDWLRHKSDNSVNNREVFIIKDGVEIKSKSKDLNVGDIVKVFKDTEFPCDLVMLSSEDENGQCQITTANLDGETNLKIHFCVPETKDFRTSESFAKLHAVIECQQPNPDLYKFIGNMKVVSDSGVEKLCALNADNVLLRGSSLKNTPHIYGCVIYNGQQTKMAMNSKMTSNKFSTVERSMNIYLVIFLLLLVVEVALCSALMYGYHSNPNVELPWYINIPSDEFYGVGNILANVLSYTVLLNYTIPISMYVTLELQKFLGSLFFGWDAELYDPITDQCARCNSSDLNEELGQVQYLFTDKTGTLTENDMQFRQCSIDGQRYVEQSGVLCPKMDADDEELQPVEEFDDHLTNFFMTLALCHTAEVSQKYSTGTINRAYTCTEGEGECDSFEKVPSDFEAGSFSYRGDGSFSDRGDGSFSDGNGSFNRHRGSTRETHPSAPVPRADGSVENAPLPEYQASSPDEKALLEVSSRFGIVFNGMVSDTYQVTCHGVPMIYERLHVLEFDSDRKCMSVVVRNPQGEVYLYCKGAENAVLSRSDSGCADLTLQHVNEYAMLGLRTLVVAQRRLSEEEYQRFDQDMQAARSALDDREEKVAEVFETVERELHILGATAVEDRLQDGVTETLTALRAAGIKIWMLTGDKEETAINIGFSCGHFNHDMQLFYLSRLNSADACTATMNEINKRMTEFSDGADVPQFSLVVDGGSLAYIFTLPDLTIFQEICHRCSAVICCRMSPIQKAMIVRLIKKSQLRPVTAAIGDGANDVSMIQEAHVGLGVMGKEGRQAVRCSDFAFARFRFLKRVLLVHGHFYYVRVAMLVQYSFYKNLAFISPQLYYVFYAWFSPQPLYDGMFLTMYNIFFTSLPILVFGLMEQNIHQDRLMAEPELYKVNANNALLSYGQFTKWTLLGFWHSVVFFYGALLLFQCEALSPYGMVFDMWCMGTLVFHFSVIIINLKLCLETRFFSGAFIFSIVGSILFFISFTLVYNATTVWIFVTGNTDMIWVYFQLFSSASVWFSCFLVLVASLAPDFTIEMILAQLRVLKHGKEQVSAARSSSPNWNGHNNNNEPVLPNNNIGGGGDQNGIGNGTKSLPNMFRNVFKKKSSSISISEPDETNVAVTTTAF